MPKAMHQEKGYYAPSQVAEMLMVSPVTVRLWASKGHLQSVQTPGGHRRFLRHELERFARERNLTLQIPASDALRILIVDDNQQVTRYLERLLATQDSIDSMSANDGFSAGRLVQVFQPQVVLLDLMMPGLDGFQVCRQIKADPVYRSVRIIAMTGFCTADNVHKALSAGAECCIAKPIDEHELFRHLGLAQLQTQL